jgi:hypothetical protein
MYINNLSYAFLQILLANLSSQWAKNTPRKEGKFLKQKPVCELNLLLLHNYPAFRQHFNEMQRRVEPAIFERNQINILEASGSK